MEVGRLFVSFDDGDKLLVSVLDFDVGWLMVFFFRDLVVYVKFEYFKIVVMKELELF